jgi:hypothetical protein
MARPWCALHDPLAQSNLIAFSCCRTCGYDSVTYDSFTDLSLSIPRRPHSVALGSDGSTVRRAADAWAAKGSEKSGPTEASSATAVTTNVLHDSVNTSVPVSPSARPAEPAPLEPAGRQGFCGALASLLCCGGGGSVDLGIGGSSVGLGDCLYSFFDWEPLTGPDQYLCERCACKRDADKRIGIACLPEVLCVHLKRFSYSSNWGGSKNSASVRFPLEGLDMAPFLQARCVNTPPHELSFQTSSRNCGFVTALPSSAGRLTQSTPPHCSQQALRAC